MKISLPKLLDLNHVLTSIAHMTTENAPPFDFAPVYELLESFNPAPLLSDKAVESVATPLPPISEPSNVPPKSSEPANLGDFSQLFEFLRLPIAKTGSGHESTESSLTPRSHHSSPPSSIPDEAIHFEEFVDRVKEVRWTDEVVGTELAEQFESEPEPSKGRPHFTRHHTRRRSSLTASADEFLSSSFAKRKSSLTPSKVLTGAKSERSLWVPPPTPKIQVDPVIIQPIYLLTVEEKKEKLRRKLKERFLVDADSLGEKDQSGIHVFVDCSNIIIGFYNALKIKRGFNIRAYTKQAPVSWHSLALILERGTC
jgi:hypothetical protein